MLNVISEDAYSDNKVRSVIEPTTPLLVKGVRLRPDRMTVGWREMLEQMAGGARVVMIVNGKLEILDEDVGNFPVFEPLKLALPVYLQPGVSLELRVPVGWKAHLTVTAVPSLLVRTASSDGDRGAEPSRADSGS